uniref:Ig-like domain-containing protein n=1 Tax=Anopheles albimanus TaxID=7167 RepID=A0A182FGG0_ANOAL
MLPSSASASGCTGTWLAVGSSRARLSVSSNIMMTTTTTEESAAYQPYFDFSVNRNVTVNVGQTGFLFCRVERLGEQDVLRPEGSVNWTLQIKYPQVRDSGVYECQINTEPKMSLSYTLNVIELRARVLGPSDIFIKSGSEITLVCVIQQGPHELGTVFWYKGNTLVEPSTQENDILTGENRRISIETDWTDVLTSRLRIKRAIQSDTGNYTCVPTMAKSASVYAHVISAAKRQRAEGGDGGGAQDPHWPTGSYQPTDAGRRTAILPGAKPRAASVLMRLNIRQSALSGSSSSSNSSVLRSFRSPEIPAVICLSEHWIGRKDWGLRCWSTAEQGTDIRSSPRRSTTGRLGAGNERTGSGCSVERKNVMPQVPKIFQSFLPLSLPALDSRPTLPAI